MYNSLLKSIGFSNVNWGNNTLEDVINKGYLLNADVYSIINLITGTASSITWELYEVKDKKAQNKYKNFQKSADIYRSNILKEEALEQVTNSKILDVLERPNPQQGWSEFIENVLGFKLLTGNSYIHGVSPKFGVNKEQYHELYILPSQYTEIITGNMLKPIAGYELNLNGIKTKFEEKEIMHLREWNPNYTDSKFLYGLSPLQVANRVLTLSNENYLANMKAAQNMGAMGILSSGDNQILEPEVVEVMEKTYREKFGGANNRGKVLVTGANIKWQNMGLSPVDLNIIQSQQMNLRTMCNVYNVNSALLNDPENKTYNNMREAKKALNINAVIPLLCSFRDEMNRWFIPAYNKTDNKNYYLDFDLNSIPELQDDITLLGKRMQGEWWWTPNEKRMMMGKDVDVNDDMNKIYKPANLVELGKEEKTV